MEARGHDKIIYFVICHDTRTTNRKVQDITDKNRTLQVLQQPMGATNNRIYEFKEDYENG